MPSSFIVVVIFGGLLFVAFWIGVICVVIRGLKGIASRDERSQYYKEKARELKQKNDEEKDKKDI